MARPRKPMADVFFDVFSDMPVAEQAIALRICEQIHRLEQRKPKRSLEIQSVPGGLNPEGSGECKPGTDQATKYDVGEKDEQWKPLI